MVIYTEMFLVPTPSTIGRTALNGTKWIAILEIHPILFEILALHSLVQIQILQTALNIGMQLSLVRLCLQWKGFFTVFSKQTELRIHLENNNQPSTPWRNQSAQTD